MASTRKGTGAPRLGQPTLTAADWAEAALQLVADSGLRALTVGALAARLGVTKGSFYWHFKGRDDLLVAALGRWEHRATREAMKTLDAVPDHRQRLQLILDASSQPPRARSLYAALAEAAGEPPVRAVLARVGAARIDYLDLCYRRIGLPAREARSRAVLAYAAYRGILQLAHESPQSLPTDWKPFTDLMKGMMLPAEAGSAGRSRPPRKGTRRST